MYQNKLKLNNAVSAEAQLITDVVFSTISSHDIVAQNLIDQSCGLAKSYNIKTYKKFFKADIQACYY